MASGDDDSEDLTSGSHEPRECMACRGTGSVISNLGGTAANVECPWCAGSGVRSAEIDAQARWGGRAAARENITAGESAAEQPAG
jgi:DnaJ-class molecular chaperone